jgi:hypothetical protein
LVRSPDHSPLEPEGRPCARSVRCSSRRPRPRATPPRRRTARPRLRPPGADAPRGVVIPGPAAGQASAPGGQVRRAGESPGPLSMRRPG